MTLSTSPATRFAVVLSVAPWLIGPFSTPITSAQTVRATCASADADPLQFFFPSGLFEYLPRGPFERSADKFFRAWYSAFLFAMNEPSLSCGKAAAPEVYRFLLLPTWGAPVTVRVTNFGATQRFESIELSGSGGYEPGLPARTNAGVLSPPDWDRLQEALGASDFWNMSTTQLTYGFDGSQWIVEGRRGDTYHVVDRWTPGENAYRALGRLFLEVGGLPKQMGNQ